MVLRLLLAQILLLLYLLLMLELVKGSLVELELLKFRRSSLKLEMSLLLVVSAHVFRRVRRLIGVGGDLADTGIMLEVLGILQEQFLVRLIEQRVSELSRTMKGRRHGRSGLGLPVDRLLFQRDLGNTGPECRGRIAHTLGRPASKTASIIVRVLGDLLLRLRPTVVAAR